MQSLNRAVDALLAGGTAKSRTAAVAELEGLLEDCTAAIQVWQEYLDAPGAPGDRWTIVSWIGPQRVKRLHEIHLVARERILRVAEAAGPAIKRATTMPEDLIEMGYRQLSDGETGSDAATRAIGIMRERMQEVRGLIERLRAAPAPKAQPEPMKRAGTAKPAAPVARKAQPKRPAKPPRKPSPRLVKKTSKSGKAPLKAKPAPKGKSALRAKPALKAVARLVRKAVKKKRR